MAISLNNHESRIKALENSSAPKVVVSGNKGYWKCSNILIQWMIRVQSSTHSWLTSFSSDTSYSAVVAGFEGGASENSGLSAQSASNISVSSWQSGRAKNIVAIGYLISDRILKYAYACKNLLFTPLRKIGGVK